MSTLFYAYCWLSVVCFVALVVIPLLRDWASARPRFGLFSAFEITAWLAFLIAIAGGFGKKLDLTQSWTKLPSQDIALINWCQRQSTLSNWSISRMNQSVTLSQFAPWYSNRRLKEVIPPWSELGYIGGQGTRISAGDTFRLPRVSLIAGIVTMALLFSIRLLRRDRKPFTSLVSKPGVARERLRFQRFSV